MASIFGIAKRGFGRALKRGKGLRPSGTGAVKSVKPGVGGLKASREAFEDLQKSSAEGVKKFGRPHTTHVISKQGVKKGKHLRSSKTGAIKSVKPGVGGLKASREAFENVQKSSAEGVRKFGRPHTTKVISKQGVKKGFAGITKQAGDLERSRKKIIKKHPHMEKQLKKVKLD